MFEVRKCINPECGLRFTRQVVDPGGDRCPRCRSSASVVAEPYASLRVEPQARERLANRPPRVEVVLDNIRSAWNVGALFRTADGAGTDRLHLCGVTPTPEQAQVRKTSLGAEKTVDWVYHRDGAALCGQLRDAGFTLWALEGGPDSISIFSQPASIAAPLAIIVGNEVSGVDPGILAQCQRIVHLPMYGEKESLNVAVAGSIAMYLIAAGGLPG